MTHTPTIESLVAAWVEAFNAHDLDRHMALYTEDAMLFGSVDELQDGRDAVRRYFAALKPEARVAEYPPPVIRHISADAAVTAAHVDFANAESRVPYRLTWTVVRRDGQWRIAQHHGSPRRGT